MTFYECVLQLFAGHLVPAAAGSRQRGLKIPSSSATCLVMNKKLRGLPLGNPGETPRSHWQGAPTCQPTERGLPAGPLLDSHVGASHQCTCPPEVTLALAKLSRPEGLVSCPCPVQPIAMQAASTAMRPHWT